MRPVDQLATSLSDGFTRRWTGGSAAFVRSGPDVSRMAGTADQAGFVLTPLTEHWASVDGAPPRPFAMPPGMGWVVPKGCEGFGDWREPVCWVELHLDGRTPEEGGSPAELAPEIQFTDPVLVALGCALLDPTPGADDPLRLDQLGIAVSERLTSRACARRGRPMRRLDDRSLTSVLAYIEDRLGEPGVLTLPVLSALAGRNVDQFARIFKRAVGTSPHRYVLDRRLDRAEHLLRTTRRPIGEIAGLCGFSNPSHLSLRMRVLRGRSPRAVRAGR